MLDHVITCGSGPFPLDANFGPDNPNIQIDDDEEIVTIKMSSLNNSWLGRLGGGR